MKLWVDAQLSPQIASWILGEFGVDATAVKDLGLRDATDEEIFLAARDENAVIMTKDSDFADLVERLGAPPQVLWVTCGNTSNPRLKEVFRSALPRALDLVRQGERLVEIVE